MSSHAEIIRSDALNSLLNGNVRVLAKIDILRFLPVANNYWGCRSVFKLSSEQILSTTRQELGTTK